MLKRLTMISLLGISLTTILAAEANAQIAGWAGFGFSEFTFVIDLDITPFRRTFQSGAGPLHA